MDFERFLCHLERVLPANLSITFGIAETDRLICDCFTNSWQRIGVPESGQLGRLTLAW